MKVFPFIFVLLLISFTGALAQGQQESGSENNNSKCLECHSGTISHTKVTLKIDEEALVKSAHKKLLCIECHTRANEIPHKTPYSLVNCIGCHSLEIAFRGESAPYRESIHAQVLTDKKKKVSLCKSCHGTHDIMPVRDASSSVNRGNIPSTCGKCHQKSMDEYLKSIHGADWKRGNLDSAVCTDCHGEHNIKSPKDPISKVSASHIADTCSRCHAQEKIMKKYGVPVYQPQAYKKSFHGVANRLGNKYAANCRSCHGYHDILPSKDPNSRTNPDNLARTCGECHQNPNQNVAKGKIHVLIDKSDNFPLFLVSATFKWITIGTVITLLSHIFLEFFKRLGEKRGIMAHPARDSQNGKNNEASLETDYTEEHMGGTKDTMPPLGRHVSEETGALAEEELPAAKRDESDDNTYYSRFSLLFRAQHILLFVGCFILIITGLPLKFSHLRISELFISLLGGLDVSRLLHRVGAVILIGVGIFHLIYIFFIGDGRDNFIALIPTPSDMNDTRDNVNYFIGLKENPPLFDRFSYMEKFVYWVVFWGMALMILSGLILWQENFSLAHLPKYFIDIAYEVHSDEALLASLTIIIWHFYDVHFKPDYFPMSWTWWNGKISGKDMKKLHALEYQRIQREKQDGSGK